MIKTLLLLTIIIFSFNSYSESINSKQQGQLRAEQGANTKFIGLRQIEEVIFGFNIENSGRSFEDRLSILEKRIVGNTSNDNILVRQRKLYVLIFLDGSYYSIMTKTDNLEDYLFQNRTKEKDLLTRVETIEEYLFGDRLGSEAIVDRVHHIYDYLLLKDSNFAVAAQFLQKTVGIIEIKAVRTYGSLFEGQTLEFNLEKDIEGVARAGSLVIGQVISREKGGLLKDEKVVIVLRKIINEERREISIYKKIEITGNASKLFFGKNVRIDELLIIG